MPGDSFRNPDAFVQLMTEHQGRLFAYILSLLGDPDQANDVLRRRIWSCGVTPVNSSPATVCRRLVAAGDC